MANPYAGVQKNWWSGVFYEESAPDNWAEVLSEMQLPTTVSPLHDRDLLSDGSFKKPHRHIVMHFDSPTRVTTALYVMAQLGSQLVKPVISPSAAVRYHCHLDNPEKALYPVSEVLAFGGGKTDALYAESAYVAAEGLSDLFDMARRYKLFSFRQLVDFLVANGDFQSLEILRQNSGFVHYYMQ